jgi:sugar phosphate isomerase/epimerase
MAVASEKTMTRKDFCKLALAAPLAAQSARRNSTIGGVMIGAQSYSFRDRPLDEAIQGMVAVGLSHCVLWQGHVEPKRISREEMRKWRTTVPLSQFAEIRRKFQRAGIRVHAYYYSFRDDFTDAEIIRGFEMAKALGVKCLEASANVTTAKRINPFAARAKMVVGMHNHAELTPNEFARPEDFEEAMRGMSHIRVNLDIGHFTAAGFDSLDFIRKHHRNIVAIDVKDRNRKGANLPFGQGETPIREVLQLLKKERYKIPVMIEYEYKGGDAVEEVRKCYEYCRQALL